MTRGDETACKGYLQELWRVVVATVADITLSRDVVTCVMMVFCSLILLTGPNALAADSGALFQEQIEIDPTIVKHSKGAKLVPKECRLANLYPVDDTDTTQGRLGVNFWLLGGKCSAGVSKNEYFYIKFDNRESRVFKSSAYKMGALTVPLKLRLNEEFNKSTVDTNANALVYISHQWGRKRYHYVKGMKTSVEDVLNVKVLLAGGMGVVGFKNDKDAAHQIGVATAGVGAALSYKGFDVGLLVGYDFGFGAHRSEWDYNAFTGKKGALPWVGLALGLGLF